MYEIIIWRIEDNIIAGTVQGGKAAAAINKARHGKDFYSKIGIIGGKNSKNGGFAHNKECSCELIKGKHYIRQCAGKKGGSISKKGSKW